MSARCARVLTKKPEKASSRKYHGPEQSHEEVREWLAKLVLN